MLYDKNIPASSPDGCSARYYSYGAFVNPRIWSVFRRPHKIVERIEGPNDGLVSVASSQWGEYKGTLVGVNHLDLINWTNRIRWLVWELTGNKRTYEALKPEPKTSQPNCLQLQRHCVLPRYRR